MGTTAQQFTPRVDASPFNATQGNPASGEVNIRRAVDIADGTPSGAAFCSTTFTASLSERVVNPETNGETTLATDAVMANYGWAIPTETGGSGDDGMDSTATEKRFIRTNAGWAILGRIGTAIAVTGQYRLRFRLYRVSASGTRTLLWGPVSSSSVTPTVAGNDVSIFATPGNIAQTVNGVTGILLEAGETVLFAFSIEKTATSVLGETIEFRPNDSVGSDVTIEVQSPGIRTVFYRTVPKRTMIGVDTITRKIKPHPTRVGKATMRGVDTLSRRLTLLRFMGRPGEVYDDSPNHVVGTIENPTGSGFVDGAPSWGYAYLFDGDDSGINAGASGTGMSGAFTLEFRVKWTDPDGLGDQHMGRWHHTDGARQNYSLGVNNNGNVFGKVRRNTGATATIQGSAGFNPVAGTWYSYAIEYDGTTFRLYVDGAVADSVAVAGLQAPDATTPLYIGRVYKNVGGDDACEMAATIDEVRLSNVARYAGAYTPSEDEFVPDANTVRLYHLERERPVTMRGVCPRPNLKTKPSPTRVGGARLDGVPTLNRKLTLHRTLAAVLVGIELIRRKIKPTPTRVGRATMRGVDSIRRKISLRPSRVGGARLDGVAVLNRRLTLHRTLSATLRGVAVIRRKIKLQATRVGRAVLRGVASLNRRLTFKRALVARLDGVASLARRLTLFRAISARLDGVASLARRLTLKRALTATLRGVARITRKMRLTSARVGGAALRGVATLARKITLRRSLVARLDGVPSFLLKTKKIIPRVTLLGVERIVRKIKPHPTTIGRARLKGVAPRPVRRIRLFPTHVGRARLDGVPYIRRKTKKRVLARLDGVAVLVRRGLLKRRFIRTLRGVPAFTRRISSRRLFVGEMRGVARGYARVSFEHLSRIAAKIRRRLMFFDD